MQQFDDDDALVDSNPIMKIQDDYVEDKVDDNN